MKATRKPAALFEKSTKDKRQDAKAMKTTMKAPAPANQLAMKGKTKNVKK